MLQVVDDFSSKLDLPRTLETVERIDVNHRQLATCRERDDPQYRAIVGIIRKFLRVGSLDSGEARSQDIPTSASHEERAIVASESSGQNAG